MNPIKQPSYRTGRYAIACKSRDTIHTEALYKLVCKCRLYVRGFMVELGYIYDRDGHSTDSEWKDEIKSLSGKL